MLNPDKTIFKDMRNINLKRGLFVELVLENAVSFKKSVDAISVLIDEAEFDVGKEGLSLKATDPSQISMVDYSLDKKAFKEYKIEGETKLGIDLDFFGSVLNRAKVGDSLRMSLNEQKSKLLLSFVGSQKRVFEVPLIDINSSKSPSPKIEFDAEIKLNADVLKDGLKDAALISTHITLGVDAEKFFMKAHSSKGKVNIEALAKDSKSIYEIKSKREAEAMFPLDYLADIVKTSSAEGPVTVKLKNNAPVQVSYEIDKAKISYFLAPRIESE